MSINQKVLKNIYYFDVDSNTLIGPTNIHVDNKGLIASLDFNIDSVTSKKDDIKEIDFYGNTAILPGYINSHYHSSTYFNKGSINNLPLELFMLYESPFDYHRDSPEEIYVRTQCAAIEMIKNGITSVHDDVFLLPKPNHENIDAVFMGYQSAGMRATIALDHSDLPETRKIPYLSDFASKEIIKYIDKVPCNSDCIIELNNYMFNKWYGNKDGRLSCSTSISAPQRVTKDHFNAMNEISKIYQCPINMHVLETYTQKKLIEIDTKYKNQSLIQHLDNIGMLSKRANLIHCVWLDDNDIQIISESNSNIIHNPISNLRLGSGIAPYKKFIDAGIHVSLGTDESVCDDSTNLLNVVKMAGLIHNISEKNYNRWPRIVDLISSLWYSGAITMGLESIIGKIKVGFKADFVGVDMRSLSFLPMNNFISQLIYCSNQSDINFIMIDGNIIIEQGTLINIDEDELKYQARSVCKKLRRYDLPENILEAYTNSVNKSLNIS
jgi:5-methylthioadenosine/S-adenosylhomocysteine deaminase